MPGLGKSFEGKTGREGYLELFIILYKIVLASTTMLVASMPRTAVFCLYLHAHVCEVCVGRNKASGQT